MGWEMADRPAGIRPTKTQSGRDTTCRTIVAVAFRAGPTFSRSICSKGRRISWCGRHIDALRKAVRRTRRERSFAIDAWVVLPDHMHCIITPPEGDDDLRLGHLTGRLDFRA
jgi:hypothetical protein